LHGNGNWSLIRPGGLRCGATYSSSQLLGLYADTGNRERTYALYGDRLLFDDEVGSVQRRMLRSSVVADVRKRLEKVGER
jgi:hypothetical protein